MIDYLKSLSWRIYKKIGFDPLTDFVKKLPHKAEVLDIGCESGNNIRKMLLVRNDLRISAIDIIDRSYVLPEGVKFFQLDVTKDKFNFNDETFDAVTCIHLIEHINDYDNLVSEILRVLKRRGRVYIETPSIRRLFLPSFRYGLREKPHVPINFLDDYTHKSLFTLGKLYYLLEDNGFEIENLKIKRNYISLLFSPFLIILGLLLNKRKLWVSALHSLIGVSIFALARKP